jgi:hypothetical protein
MRADDTYMESIGADERMSNTSQLGTNEWQDQ